MWYKAVWCRSAQIDSHQVVLGVITCWALLLFSIPPSLFGLHGLFAAEESHINGLCRCLSCFIRFSLLASVVPCRTHLPSLEETGMAECILYHTNLKISHQNNRQLNNFCKMFMSWPTSFLSHILQSVWIPSTASRVSISSSAQTMNKCLVMYMHDGRAGWKKLW